MTRAGPSLSPFYAKRMKGKRVLIVDDVRNTGTTFKRCADLVAAAGGTVIATMQIIDRCEACVSLDVPNVALVEYKAPPNYPAASCPMCAAGSADHHLLIARQRSPRTAPAVLLRIAGAGHACYGAAGVTETVTPLLNGLE